jgi:KTSC domain-containing protein
MDRIPVSSTELASIGYEEANSVLEVEFRKGGVYRYFEVPVEVFKELMAAPSKGSYFNRVIRGGNYRYSRM